MKEDREREEWDPAVDLPGLVDGFRREDSAGRDLALNHVLNR